MTLTRCVYIPVVVSEPMVNLFRSAQELVTLRLCKDATEADVVRSMHTVMHDLNFTRVRPSFQVAFVPATNASATLPCGMSAIPEELYQGTYAW